eukprot:COSAG02_NODE_38429_length_429_cov_0.727273_1_plen_38_part_10
MREANFPAGAAKPLPWCGGASFARCVASVRVELSVALG